jgi:YggT family protein
MLGPLMDAIVTILDMILKMLQVAILASILVSWVGADPSNQLVQMIRSLTEPMYRPIRRVTRRLPGPIDWAPMVLILVIIFVERGVLPYLKMIGGGPSFG